MSSAVLTSPVMARKTAAPDDGVERRRVPVRLDVESQDKLREMAVVWLRQPIEWLAGEWLAERIETEYKAGRKAAEAKKKKG